MDQEIVKEWASETLEEMELLLAGDSKSIGRFFHSVKGTSSFFGMKNFQELAHKGEELLVKKSPEVGEIIGEIRAALTRILTPQNSLQDPYTRVKKESLSHISEQAQELTLLQSQIKPHIPNLLMQRLNRISSTLQGTIARARMGLLSHFLRNVPRMVSETSKNLQKKVRFEMVGVDIEMDREILTLLKQPLYHILRNSIDHGVELPSIRKKAGKNETGLIKLAAHRNRNEIRIEIADDGAGIDLDKIRKKLSSRLSAQELKKLSKDQLLKHLYQTGLTTSDKVTKISGRGLGMGAIRDAIENFSGQVEIQTEKGKGTTIQIILPIRDVVAPIVTFLVSENQVFGLLAQEVHKILKMEKEKLETLRGSSFLKVNDAMLPVIDLEKDLQLTPAAPPQDQGFIIVCRNRPICLKIRKILQNYETLVHPMPAVLDHIQYANGIAISQEGHPNFMLNLNHFTEEKTTTKEERIIEKNLGGFLIVQAQGNLKENDPLTAIMTEKVHHVGKIEGLTSCKNNLFFENEGELQELTVLNNNRKPRHFALVENTKGKRTFLGFEKAVSYAQLRKDKKVQILDGQLIEILEI